MNGNTTFEVWDTTVPVKVADVVIATGSTSVITSYSIHYTKLYDSTNSVPCPGVERTSTAPLMRSRFLRTTSIPTPRPDTSDRTLAVEKPGSKMKFQASRSSMVAGSALSRPRSAALASIASRSRPLPSSLTLTLV